MNCNETGFCLGVSFKKVLAGKDAKVVHDTVGAPTGHSLLCIAVGQHLEFICHLTSSMIGHSVLMQLHF